MPRHFEKRVVPYAAPQMFDLVADIESYPLFLPWCRKAVVTRRDGDRLTADLTVGAKSFCETFTSVVTLARPGAIHVAYGGGPLSHLRNEWIFTPLPDGACEIAFLVEFQFRSRFLGAMMDLFFDAAFRKMAAAFEARAGAVYGRGYDNG